jgi:hypothetical protein
MKRRSRRPVTAPRDAQINQADFRAIMIAYDLTTGGAAALLSDASGRPVSQITVKSWLVAPGKVSARPCPRWAVDLLKIAALSATDAHRDLRVKRD